MPRAEGSTRLRPGETFLRFRIERILGEGGLGVVYAATEGPRTCALKLVKASWLDDEDQRRRLVREGALLELIKHPNIVDVHETGITCDGIAWMRMELLRGATLREVLHRRGRLPTAVACSWLRQASHGVYQCHAMGVIHRDLKPENLFVTEDGTVKVLDLGIAKLYGNPDTLDQQTHGTPLYMAPEQIRAEPVSAATDVYALGLIAYEALAGEHPFKPAGAQYDVRAVYARQLLDAPLSLLERGVEPELSRVVSRALDKEPEARPRDALELSECLRAAHDMAARRSPALGWMPGPAELRALVVPGDAERGRTEAGATPGAIAHAATERLPDSLRDPSCVQATGGRRPSLPGAPARGVTERLPDSLRDPSCMQALEGRRSSLPPIAVTPPALRPGDAEAQGGQGPRAKVEARRAPRAAGRRSAAGLRRTEGAAIAAASAAGVMTLAALGVGLVVLGGRRGAPVREVAEGPPSAHAQDTPAASGAGFAVPEPAPPAAASAPDLASQAAPDGGAGSAPRRSTASAGRGAASKPAPAPSSAASASPAPSVPAGTPPKPSTAGSAATPRPF